MSSNFIEMTNFPIYSFGCAIILLIFGRFWIRYSPELFALSAVEFTSSTLGTDFNAVEAPIDSTVPKASSIKDDQTKENDSENYEISEKMERKRKILERGCSMMHSLFEMSQNGTSYDDLLTWHSRIHDLSLPLAPHLAPNEKCYPPLQSPDANSILYQVPVNGPSSTALFCLPPKCGTTSYQKALVQHVTNVLVEKQCDPDAKWGTVVNGQLVRAKDECYDRYYLKSLKNSLTNLNANKGFISKIGSVKILSDDVPSPAVYWVMNTFKNVEFINPMTFLERDGETTPIYPQLRPSEKRILNTRNPFSRLYAAWGDKFRSTYYKEPIQKNVAVLSALLPQVDRAEPTNSSPSPGYTNTFHGFLRYVTQEKDEKHLNRHWQSIAYLCQPCRFAYDYIMDIENANEDSEYVFQQLDFDAKLPHFHQSSKSTKKSLEDYYKNIPKALIKKLYAKYFLDFVLFGFSPDSVKSIVDAGTDEPSEYSFSTNKGFDKTIFKQFRKVIVRALWALSIL